MSEFIPLFCKKRVWYGQSESIESDVKSENVGFRIKDVIQAIEKVKEKMSRFNCCKCRNPEMDCEHDGCLETEEAIDDVFFGKKVEEDEKNE